MFRFFRTVFGLVLFLSMSFGTQAEQLNSPSLKPSPAIEQEDIEIRLITFSPYDDIFAWFGHSALEVRDKKTGKAYAFNFGGFYFDMEQMLEFVLGRFTFWSSVQETERALLPYQAEGRQIVFQTLNLTKGQKKRIRSILVDSTKPANRYYQYDHFRENCSTRLRDIIDEALDGALKAQSTQRADLTYKEFIHRMTTQQYPLNFILLFLLNDTLDQPITHWDSAFLPDRLMMIVQQAKNPNLGSSPPVFLVKRRQDQNIGQGEAFFLTKATRADTRKREIVFGAILLFIFGTSALLYGKNQSRLRTMFPGLVSIFGLIFGSLGFVLFLMMCFTEHKDTYWNENILILNPITLLLFPVGILKVFNKSEGLFAWLCTISGVAATMALLLKVLPMFDQENGQPLRVLLPTLFIIGLAGIVDLKNRNQSLQTNNIA